MGGFFRSSQLASTKITKRQTISQCGKCGLHKTCKNPKMSPTGSGDISILHIDQKIGAAEEKANDFFVDSSGKYYRRALQKLDVDIDDCIKTSAVICSTKNKKPNKTQLTSCFPNLKKVISDYSPKVIIPVGDSALESLVSHKFDKTYGAVSTFRGFAIPDREYNAWIVPVFDPGYVTAEKTGPAAKKIFADDLQYAMCLVDTELPKLHTEDLESKVEYIKHTKEITAWISDLLKREDEFMFAFDYETTGLKPQHPDQKIRTCSISLGPNEVVVFPFSDDVKFLQKFSMLLQKENIKKIAANAKYENDWSNVKLNSPINGWLFDPMLAQHCVDNRQRICSLEFQSYVYFGIQPYDAHIKQFLKTEPVRGNAINRVFEADLKDLMLYNALDSLITFRLAIVQMELLGIDYKQYYNQEITAEELAPQVFIRRTKCN